MGRSWQFNTRFANEFGGHPIDLLAAQQHSGSGNLDARLYTMVRNGWGFRVLE
jgi:hypothetical protein